MPFPLIFPVIAAISAFGSGVSAGAMAVIAASATAAT